METEKRMQKAKKGEYKAIKFMKSQGFRVTDLQKEGPTHFL